MTSPFRSQAEVDDARDTLKKDEFSDRLFAELDAVDKQVIEGDLVFQEDASAWLDELEQFIHNWQAEKSTDELPSLSTIDAVNDFTSEYPPSTETAKTAAVRLRNLLSK